tara:strand:+ start:2381 stop:5191 length:2811 start_codon:yes stop_codon:yes gene_type:complete
MTVATDLQVAHGIHRVLYLAIDGLAHYLFQHSHHGVPTWSRPIKVCLQAPEEKSMGLDLGKMRSDLSAMTFRLDDTKESDLTSFFGKLFSTGRWNNNPHVRLNAGTNFGEYLNAQATTIAIRSNVGFASTAGNGYIGGEAINWGGVNATHVQAAGRGLFSAINVGQPWGKTYALPPEGGQAFNFAVGTVPFAFAGRRVALYVTTWDYENSAFKAESESELLWTGRADDQISQDGRTGVWMLSCKSILQEIERKVPTQMPVSYLNGLNIRGPRGLRFRVYFYNNLGGLMAQKLITIPSGIYTAATLARIIEIDLIYTAWTSGTSGLPLNGLWFTLHLTATGDKGKARFWGSTKFGFNGGKFVIDPIVDDEPCHALGALGFGSRDKRTVEINDNSENPNIFQGELKAKDNFFESYHPLGQNYNGKFINVDEPLRFWADQGDDPDVSQAAVVIDDAQFAPYWKNLAVPEGNYLARYKTRTNAAGLELTHDPTPIVSKDGFVGSSSGKKRTKVTQVYLPAYIQDSGKKKGPFELLLTVLLSTGTEAYNGSYDKGPLELGLGIQQDLVDIPSFLSADKAIMHSAMAHRVLWPIFEPTSFLDLISKEGQLFGYALVWRNGKLRVRPVMQPDTEAWTVNLTDNNMADENEFPSPTMSTGTVVNQYKLDIVYSAIEGKFGKPITVTDADSVIGITETKQVSIKHTGIFLDTSKVKLITRVIKQLLLGRFIRFPLPVIDRSLSAVLLNRVFVGDLVKVTSSRLQDPFGTGTRTTSGFGIVLNVSWNYKTSKGSAKVMLLDWPAAAAWSPAALVDQSAANGGFHVASNSLILSPHTWTDSDRFHDGAGVGEIPGWNVLLLERAPLDPTNPTIHGPFKAGLYSSDNFALPLNGAPSGWNNAIEHVVTFADFADINATQFDNDKGTWQADKATEIINAVTGTKAQRYR